MTRYLLGGALVIGLARLLFAIPVSSQSPMAAALEMRDHLVRKGMGPPITCWSGGKHDFGGIRYLPRNHKDSLWPHVQKLYAAQRAQLVDVFANVGCRLGPDPESLVRDLALLPQ